MSLDWLKMPNPLEVVRDLKEMNEAITERLDKIIDLLEILIETEQVDYYGDGK